MNIVTIAPAGSGKTRLIIEEIRKRVEGGDSAPRIHQSDIAVISFTNAAANVIQERIYNNLDTNSQLGFCGTLHQFCLRIIQEVQTGVAVIPAEDALRIIKGEAQKMKSKVPAKDYPEAIRNAWATQSISSVRGMSELQQLSTTYRRYMKANNLVDYDGILGYALEMLKSIKIVGPKIPDYIYIDEFQDSGDMDMAIYRQLERLGVTLFVVGDPAQSIYKFRGGCVENILALWEDPNWQRKTLDTNYRSAKGIVDAAETLVSANKSNIARTVNSFIESDHKIEVINTFGFGGNEAWQQNMRAFEIANRDIQEGKSVAILARTNSLVRELKNSASGFPIQSVVQRKMPVDWKHAKRILSMLASPYNWTVAKFWMEDSGNDMSSTEFIALKQTCSPFEHFNFPENLTSDDALNYLSKFGTGLDSVMFLKEVIQERKSNRLQDLNTSIMADEQPTTMEGENGIFVGTIHSAKGMEFDTVILVGLEDTIFPMGKTPDIEEERRLLYVAITRAKTSFYALHTDKRKVNYGKFETVVETGPSILAKELSHIIQNGSN